MCFWDFTNFWVCLYYFKLLHLIHISKGHKCSGLFCTKLQVLWFLTLFILPVKHEISLFLTKFACKASLNNSNNTILCHFLCIFRALWLVTSWATGAPMSIESIPRAQSGACAHGEVIAHLFNAFLSHLNSCINEFHYF